jgi:Mitochondrial ribosomal subunit protein
MLEAFAQVRERQAVEEAELRRANAPKVKARRAERAARAAQFERPFHADRKHVEQDLALFNREMPKVAESIRQDYEGIEDQLVAVREHMRKRHAVSNPPFLDDDENNNHDNSDHNDHDENNNANASNASNANDDDDGDCDMRLLSNDLPHPSPFGKSPALEAYVSAEKRDYDRLRPYMDDFQLHPGHMVRYQKRIRDPKERKELGDSVVHTGLLAFAMHRTVVHAVQDAMDALREHGFERVRLPDRLPDMSATRLFDALKPISYYAPMEDVDHRQVVSRDDEDEEQSFPEEEPPGTDVLREIIHILNAVDRTKPMGGSPAQRHDAAAGQARFEAMARVHDSLLELALAPAPWTREAAADASASAVEGDADDGADALGESAIAKLAKMVPFIDEATGGAEGRAGARAELAADGLRLSSADAETLHAQVEERLATTTEPAQRVLLEFLRDGIGPDTTAASVDEVIEEHARAHKSTPSPFDGSERDASNANAVHGALLELRNLIELREHLANLPPLPSFDDLTAMRTTEIGELEDITERLENAARESRTALGAIMQQFTDRWNGHLGGSPPPAGAATATDSEADVAMHRKMDAWAMDVVGELERFHANEVHPDDWTERSRVNPLDRFNFSSIADIPDEQAAEYFMQTARQPPSEMDRYVYDHSRRFGKHSLLVGETVVHAPTRARLERIYAAAFPMIVDPLARFDTDGGGGGGDDVASAGERLTAHFFEPLVAQSKLTDTHGVDAFLGVSREPILFCERALDIVKHEPSMKPVAAGDDESLSPSMSSSSAAERFEAIVDLRRRAMRERGADALPRGALDALDWLDSLRRNAKEDCGTLDCQVIDVVTLMLAELSLDPKARVRANRWLLLFRQWFEDREGCSLPPLSIAVQPMATRASRKTKAPKIDELVRLGTHGAVRLTTVEYCEPAPPDKQTAKRTQFAQRKVRLAVDMYQFDLAPAVYRRLASLAERRFNPSTGVLTLVADAYPSSAVNRRYALQLFRALLSEALLADPRFVPLSDLHTPVDQTIAEAPETPHGPLLPPDFYEPSEALSANFRHKDEFVLFRFHPRMQEQRF